MRAWRLLDPPVPAQIRDALEHYQYSAIDRQVPMLHGIAILNVLITMAVCRANGFPLHYYGWMFLVVLFSGWRMIRWKTISERHQGREWRAKLLKGGVSTTIGMIAMFSAWGCWSLAMGYYSNPLIVPVSYLFGALSVTQGLASLRAASLGGMMMAVFPMATTMSLVGDPPIRMLGVILFVVALFKIRMNVHNHERLVQSLLMEQENVQLANTDSLTGLSNRRAIMAELENAESAWHVGHASYGIALIDLDGFKAVNDRHGHHIGDRLLKAVADRLSAHARAGDVQGRLGGDEFIILFRNLSDAQDVPTRATELLTGLCKPVVIDGISLPIAASLGYALVPHDGDSTDALLIVADRALYKAKQARPRPAARNRVIKAA